MGNSVPQSYYSCCCSNNNADQNINKTKTEEAKITKLKSRIDMGNISYEDLQRQLSENDGLQVGQKLEVSKSGKKKSPRSNKDLKQQIDEQGFDSLDVRQDLDSDGPDDRE